MRSRPGACDVLTWYEPEDLGPEQDARDRAYGRRNFWVYVLTSDYGHYVGHTSNPWNRLPQHYADEVPSTAGGNADLAWITEVPLRSREDAKRYEAALKSWRNSESVEFTEHTGLVPVPWRGWSARVEEPREGSFSSRGSVEDPVRRRRFSDSRGPEGVFRRSSSVGARPRKKAVRQNRSGERSYGGFVALAVLVVFLLVVVGVSVLSSRDDREWVLELFDSAGAPAEERRVIEDADHVVLQSCVFDRSAGGSDIEIEVDGVVRRYFVHFRDVCSDG